MPKLYNDEKNICWELNLILSEYIDFNPNRPDSQNWVPFLFSLNVDGSIYKFNEQGTCFTVWETKKIIDGFDNIIGVMRINSERDIFKPRFELFVHTCYEVFFDLEISDADTELLEIGLWLNMGYINNSGYHTGFRFNVSLEEFIIFTEQLRSQFREIMSVYN